MCVVLQAASFGKCFLTDFSPDHFVTTCRELRVLNAVRDGAVGLPLTHTQYPLTALVHHGTCSGSHFAQTEGLHPLKDTEQVRGQSDCENVLKCTGPQADLRGTVGTPRWTPVGTSR